MKNFERYISDIAKVWSTYCYLPEYCNRCPVDMCSIKKLGREHTSAKNCESDFAEWALEEAGE